jgi:hypothetical protein
MSAPVPITDLSDEKRATGLQPERMSDARFRANVIVGGVLFVGVLVMLVAGIAVAS